MLQDKKGALPRARSLSVKLAAEKRGVRALYNAGCSHTPVSPADELYP